jgi:hypothetical protein
MKIVVRLLLAAGLIVLGFWLWTVLFPGPEKLIRKRLAEVARLASITPGEGLVSQGLRIQGLVNCFDPQAELRFDLPGRSQYTITGRDEMIEYAGAARRNLRSLKVELLDPNLTLSPDKQSAVVDLTARVKIPDERDFFVQEMKFTLKKINGEWLIIRVETVRTLSQARTGDHLAGGSSLHLDPALPLHEQLKRRNKMKTASTDGTV